MQFDVNVIELVCRWLHVLSAIALLGGSIFIRFVLLNAVEGLAEDQQKLLHERIMRTWKIFVHASITFLFLAGFANYIMKIQSPAKPGSVYHMVMGIKILAGLAVMFLVSGLVGRSAALQPLRDQKKFWMLVTILLGVSTVMMGGFLKVAKIPTKEVITNKQ